MEIFPTGLTLKNILQLDGFFYIMKLKMKLYEKYGKRGIDLLLATVGIVVLLPLFLVIGILICMESRGGIFFLQKRVGKGKKKFRLIKFRTMKQKKKKEKEFTPGEKERITKIGGILRETKLDELPTLVNVIKGDLSLVGPRPEVEEYVKIYFKEWNEILKVKPGITDFASIEYRHEEKLLQNHSNPEKLYVEKILPHKLKLNKLYVKNISLKEDLKILFTTLRCVMFSKGKQDLREEVNT